MGVIAATTSQTPVPAVASVAYLDRRVSALPAGDLLHADPRTLVDPRRQAIGRDLERYFEPLFFAWAATQIAAFFIFWSSGGAARLRDLLRRRIHNVALLRFTYGVALAIFGGLAALPASLLRYRLANVYDLSHQSLLDWVRVSLANVALDAIGVGSVVAIVFALVDRTRLWWAISIAVLFSLALAVAYVEPVAIAPLFDPLKPISHRSLEGRRIDALERRVKLQDVPDYTQSVSRRTGIVQGRADGFLNTKRIIIGDTALLALTPGELDVLVATALGHYVAGDGAKTALFGTFLFIVCIASGVAISDRAGFRRDDDPLARLALVAALVGTAGLVALPVYHAYVRVLAAAADRYALALTHDPVSAVRLSVRLADESLEPLCPGRIERYYFALQPPPAERIAAAAHRPNRCR